jgi:hypothetical protein
MSRVLVAVGVVFFLLASATAEARVVKSKRNAKVANEVVIGSRIEMEDHEYEVPVLIEWSPSSRLELSMEYAYGKIETDSGERVSGFKDLDLAAVYELVQERRDRPALALELTAKVPTAGNIALGTGKADFGVGLTLSREFVKWDAQLGVEYTFIGSPAGTRLSNTYEISAEAEYHPSSFLDVFGEVVVAHGGNSSGFGIGGPTPSASSGNGFEFEFTAGAAQHLTSRLKLEEGITYSGGIVFVLGCEYNFGFSD